MSLKREELEQRFINDPEFRDRVAGWLKRADDALVAKRRREGNDTVIEPFLAAAFQSLRGEPVPPLSDGDAFCLHVEMGGLDDTLADEQAQTEAMFGPDFEAVIHDDIPF
jgi:hypothetical protein